GTFMSRNDANVLWDCYVARIKLGTVFKQKQQQQVVKVHLKHEPFAFPPFQVSDSPELRQLGSGSGSGSG
ncbi:hypothetical protein TorRG33x02_045990, partial [Trema orientale]